MLINELLNNEIILVPDVWWSPKIEFTQIQNVKNAFLDMIQKATVLNIQNVADYYYVTSDQEYWYIKDFPQPVSPWVLGWFEYKMPLIINSREFGIRKRIPQSNELWIERVGQLLITYEFKKDWDKETYLKNVEKFLNLVLVGCSKGLEENYFINILRSGEHRENRKIRWILEIFTITKAILHDPSTGWETKAYLHNICCFVFMDEDGFILETDDSVGIVYKNMLSPPEDFSSETFKNFVTFFAPHRNCLLLALSFINCRNVHIVENIADAKAQKAREKKHKKPLLTYYTLKIDPIKKVLEHTRKTEKCGLKQALHICRGHFKDFRRGPGLFGKYKDIYWWNQYLRGSGKEGVILKDYELGGKQ